MCSLVADGWLSTCTERLACVLCGTEENIATCESWAGRWHSACNHAYCSACLEQYISDELAKCCSEGLLAVYCGATGCKKRMPQSMILTASVEARIFASMVDNDKVSEVAICKYCETPSRRHLSLLTNQAACAHRACLGCWTNWMQVCLPTAVRDMALDIPCIDTACREGCRSILRLAHSEIARGVYNCDPRGELQSHLAHLDSRMRVLREINSLKSTLRTFEGQVVQAVVHREDTFRGPTCPVCQEVVVALVSDPGCANHHVACEDCWARWAEEHLDACVADYAIDSPCMWPDCATRLATHLGLWYAAAHRSTRVMRLTKDLEHRTRLQHNTLYPASMQVECPLAGCVGMGYLGFDTVMCFMCEHQWLPEESGVSPGIPDVEEVMGVAVKKCPRCEEYIEKNGGCDHMTCRCKHEFYWSTLKPYRR
mmetsp:Transcript_60283/g.111805  ORF Transcript_60283/g.111805 Transcript_60283/m.111805 type:complete len:427 (+) Transcript_60283:38-1318(+)